MATKVILRDVVPDGEYFAARSGDSPFPPGFLLAPGTELARPTPAWQFPEVGHEPVIPFDYQVVYEDSRILVVDKPHFLPATPNGRIVRETLQTRLRARYGDKITVIHRLDRLTAGLMLAVKNPEDRAAYHELFSRREVRKTYLARLSLPMDPQPWQELRLGMRKEGRRVVVDKHGTQTVTLWRTLDDDPTRRTVELRPLTGHTHQLRVVCAHLGAGIFGDDMYPVERELDLYDYSEPLHLLATSLEFSDPLDGSAREFLSARGLPTRMV
ncbi:pseudouridine synthase [Corynebacterium lubricantis]|uniref:pseudouridine synthase n=1 Tax=Corynebacterium lubricantis TaxID=541095 RepID=UPI0003621025|nr:pseudouridine synthase [Corynebacterium lubricantis]